MADRKSIIALPNSNLRQKSTRVKTIDDSTLKLVKDMEAATLDWEDHRDHEFGVALAAIQIDRAEKVVVVRSNMDDKSDRSFIAFINPKIIQKKGDIEYDFEGCLSVKDYYCRVGRYPKVKVRAEDKEGKEFTMKLEGFLARVMQHEVDHTKGTLIVDKAKGDEDGFYKIGSNGKLEKLDYDEVLKNSDLLW